MTGRIRADNPAIETVRGTLRASVTGLVLDVPSDATSAVAPGDVVRIELEGGQRFGRFRETATADVGATLHGIYDTPDLARDPDGGEDRFRPWCREHDLGAGRSVLIDVLEPGFRLGFRAPGEDRVYDQGGAPDPSLASIAEDLHDHE